jgi:hypothetical protein
MGMRAFDEGRGGRRTGHASERGVESGNNKDGQRMQHQRLQIALKITEIAVSLKEAVSTTQRGAKRRSPSARSPLRFFFHNGIDSNHRRENWSCSSAVDTSSSRGVHGDHSHDRGLRGRSKNKDRSSVQKSLQLFLCMAKKKYTWTKLERLSPALFFEVSVLGQLFEAPFWGLSHQATRLYLHGIELHPYSDLDFHAISRFHSGFRIP